MKALEKATKAAQEAKINGIGIIVGEKYAREIARAVIASIEVDDAMVGAGINEALAIMREHGVDGLSPFEAYPSPAETTSRVLKAVLHSILTEGEK